MNNSRKKFRIRKNNSDLSLTSVVAVTINYRLGPMSFLCLPQLAQEAGHTGNYGLYDQLTAVRMGKLIVTTLTNKPVGE